MAEKYSNEALEIKNKAEKIKEKWVTKNEVKSLDNLKLDIKKLKDSEETKTELNKLIDEIKSQAKNSETANPWVLDKVEENKLQTMSNKDFIKTYSKENRLDKVTNWCVKFWDIENWAVKNIEFKFSFNWNLNKELYLKTTLWQLLPSNVSEVVCNWMTYKRAWMSWEFFSDSNKRLIIHDKTQITIWALRSADELKVIETKNQETYSWYIKENPTANKDIVKEAIYRWIDPWFAVIAFKEALEKEEKEEDKKALLEDMFTEFDRLRSIFEASNDYSSWKYDKFLTLTLLKKFNPETWEDIAKKQLNYTEDDIIDINNIWDVNDTDDVEILKKLNLAKSINYTETQDFMEDAKSIAQEIEKIYWIPWKVTVWQCALESDWWRSELSSKYNNYFWIKSFWKWESVNMKTNEEYNWKIVKTVDWFKVFDNMKDSFIWYARFLTENPRYKNAFKYWVNLTEKPDYYPKSYIWYNPELFITELKKAKYATDSNYVSKVINVWKKFDKIA